METAQNDILSIETKLSYLEDFLNKLQGIAVEHSRAIEQLQAENRGLRLKIGELEDSIPESTNTRPPHY